ncbi:MAG: tetratricopeptide repeat protein [Bacteroidetes bacterium]|nr:tetratricopeptide repeat protein [Bacteroidota bacterium]
MRLKILTPALAFSILLIFGCTEEKPASVMPVTTDSELALELYETGVLAYDQFKQKLALHNLYMAVEQDPDFFMAYFWMFYMSSKDSKKAAEKAFQSEAQLNPAEEQVRMALKYLVDGQEEKVVEHLQNLVDMYPSDPQTHKILYLLQQMYFKDYEGAIISLKRAIRECPDFPLAYNQLGYAYTELEDYENAEVALDNYIRLAPDQPNPYDSKGDYFMETEQYEEAYESYMKANEIEPGFDKSEKKAKKARMLQQKTAQ